MKKWNEPLQFKKENRPGVQQHSGGKRNEKGERKSVYVYNTMLLTNLQAVIFRET